MASSARFPSEMAAVTVVLLCQLQLSKLKLRPWCRRRSLQWEWPIA